MTLRYSLVAPVAPDGSFALDGAPRHKLRVFVVVEGLSEQVMGGTNITVRGPVVTDLALAVRKSTRVVHVLVRNTVDTRLTNAQVFVLEGNVPSMNLFEMNSQFQGGIVRWARQVEGERAPQQIVDAARPGDLFATMTEVPDGAASACAYGLPDLSDDELGRKMFAHPEKITMTCTPIREGADLVTIEVPPFPRLD